MPGNPPPPLPAEESVLPAQTQMFRRQIGTNAQLSRAGVTVRVCEAPQAIVLIREPENLLVQFRDFLFQDVQLLLVSIPELVYLSHLRISRC